MNEDYSERLEYAINKTQKYKDIFQIEAFLGENNLLTIRSAMGKILESKVIQDAGIGIRILKEDGGLGFSSTCDFSDEAIIKSIDEALAISKFRKVDPSYSFAVPRKSQRNANFYDKQLVEAIYEYDNLNETINQALQETLEFHPAIKEVAGPAHFVEYKKHIINSNEVDLSEKGTYWNAELMAIAETSLDRREGSDSSAGFAVKELNLSQMATKAGDMAVKSLNGKKVDAGTYEIIFSPMSMSTFLGWFVMLTNPQNQEKNMPLLKDKIGGMIASERFIIGNDPLKVASPVSGLYDDEGTPTEDIIIVENGIFKTMPLDTFYASKFQTRSNGSGYRLARGSGMTNYPGQLYQSEPIPIFPSIYMEGGGSDVERMIESTRKGIYLDFLHYAYITNGGTGDYTGILRQGTFLIESGEIIYPIKKCRLMDNIIEMAKNIELIGEPKIAGHWRDMRLVPPVKISSVDIIPY
ncbi:MAG: TldD/PmbA family protein [Candidatus Heimdallarchaeota archaeon]|nr:TldD/PmbA family protein [Candidatus Heimdallarchaeota archaeon]